LQPPNSSSSLQSIGKLATVIVLTLLVPIGVTRLTGAGPEPERLPYLPAFERTREYAFHAHRIAELQRLRPRFVVIGDSMAGTRINERLLGTLIGRPIAPLLQAGSGSAFWYLALKNWVIASGVRPDAVFIFFRDTNLTDTMFRLDEQFRWSLDLVAGEREDELNAIVTSAVEGPWRGAHRAIERVYGGDRSRRLLEPALNRLPTTWITTSRRRQAGLLAYINDRFGLAHLRVMEASDMEADEGTDFHAVVGRSVLPVMIRDARRSGIRLCFVRVQRRPIDDGPPPQSRALRRYVADLRRYLEEQGALFHDDTGDPALTLDMYGDGDHIAAHARDRYTRLLYERLRPLFESSR
jgi:hypothetical protein